MADHDGLWTTTRLRPGSCQTEQVPPRFYVLADVAEQLNVTTVQVRALVQSGELPAIQVGGRGQWRIEATELEAYIQRKYAETRAMVQGRPDAAGHDLAPDAESLES